MSFLIGFVLGAVVALGVVVAFVLKEAAAVGWLISKFKDRRNGGSQ